MPKNNVIKIIAWGDIMGKIGRRAVAQLMPIWGKKYQPDLWIANVENLAHGRGVTAKTVQEMHDLGINIMTGGNHSWRNADTHTLGKMPDIHLITPHNNPLTKPGDGYCLHTIRDKQLLVINLLGDVNIKAIDPKSNDGQTNSQSPFTAVDELLADPKIGGQADIIIVDFHAEISSEKRALGWHLDGRASAVYGTHTHIPTADAQIMPNGTAYITDIGMTGAYQSVLGIDKDTILDRFINNGKLIFQIPERGQAEAHAIYLEIDANNAQAHKIELLRALVEIN